MDDISSKKGWGTLLHYTLSKLEGRFQIEDLCNQIYLEGLCSEKDKCRLILKLQDLLSHPKLEDFFHERWSVKTEQEILLPNGESYIPDRILFSEKKTYNSCENSLETSCKLITFSSFTQEEISLIILFFLCLLSRSFLSFLG